MAETVMLSLEARYESFTLGKTVTVEQVRATQAIAQKHGFRIANPRSFERPITDEQIDLIRDRAHRKRSGISPAGASPGAQAAPA